MKGFIYKLVGTDGTFYIGSTQDVYDRKANHISEAFGKGSNNPEKDELVKKYVDDNSFELEVVEEFDNTTKKELSRKEFDLIDKELTRGAKLTNKDGAGPRLYLIDRRTAEVIGYGRTNEKLHETSGIPLSAIHRTQYSFKKNYSYILITEEQLQFSGCDYYSFPVLELVNRETGEIIAEGRNLKQLSEDSGLNIGAIYNYNSQARKTHYIQTVKGNTHDE